MKSSAQFLYSYDDEPEIFESVEEVDAEANSEAQKTKQRMRIGKDVVDEKRLKKTTTLVQADERTALLSS